MLGVQRSVDLILGKTGSGKTTLARQLIRSRSRVIIADADYHEYPALEFQDLATLTEYLEAHAGAAQFFRVSYTPYEDEYPIMCDLSRLVGNCTLVLEEADRFPDPRYCIEYQEIIARGRHHRISIIALGLYPALLPSMLRRQATRIFAFRQHEPADIDWLAAVMGESAKQLPQLGDHEYLEWTPGAGSLTAKKLMLDNNSAKVQNRAEVTN